MIDEPSVKVLLFSDLFGAFLDDRGSFDRCADAYRTLAEAGMEIIFISGALQEIAREALSTLLPQPALIAAGGKAVFAPESSPLAAAAREGASPQRNPDQLSAAEWAAGVYRGDGDIVLSFGVGDAKDDTFLKTVDVAALIPGPEGEICPLIPRPEVVYCCNNPGQEGWNEWADLMLKKIVVINFRI